MQYFLKILGTTLIGEVAGEKEYPKNIRTGDGAQQSDQQGT